MNDKIQIANAKNIKFYRLSFYIWHCFVICALTFVICGNTYALNIDKLKVYFLQGDYRSSISEGEKILANSRDACGLEELYYILGLSYMKEGNYLRASDIFEIILKEFKGSVFDSEAALGLADTYFLRGDFEKAAAGYRELLKAGCSEKLKAAAYYRLSRCAFNTGNIEEGKEYSDKLNSEYPKNFESRLGADIVLSLDFYSIQVGSFSSYANAENLRDKLTKKNYDAYIQEAVSGGKKSYRVKVGKLKSRSEAVQLESRLSSEGYPTKITP